MEEIFSRVVAMLLGCTLMIVLPLIVVRERQKNMEQTYLYTETIEFVDGVCNKGIIYEENYINYLDKISILSGIYNVKMEKYSKDRNQYNDYTSQITESLENNSEYMMKIGDLFRISVIDREGNPVVYYGGKIKDEDY